MANSKKKKDTNVVKHMWCGFGIIVASVLLLFVLIYNGVIGYMPPIDQLKNPTDKFASTIYAAGGEEMGRYYRSKGNRVYVDFDQLSKYLPEALIATEDVRFMSHSGIDVKAIFRAMVKRVIMGQKSAGGGSTITQQLAKQLYSPESSNIFERALQKPDLKEMLYPLPPYFEVEICYKKHQSALSGAQYPGARQIDDTTVAFETDDYMEVLRIFKFILSD